MTENPYRLAREVENDALARMTPPSPKELGWDEGHAAGEAAERERIVKMLREDKSGARGIGMDKEIARVVLCEAADLIERTAKNPEHE